MIRRLSNGYHATPHDTIARWPMVIARESAVSAMIPNFASFEYDCMSLSRNHGEI
jgi:hypothetical protein